MGAMADGLQCDASQVTWLVDRLEERGFVVEEIANDSSGREVTGVGELRHGPRGADAADYVRLLHPSAVLPVKLGGYVVPDPIVSRIVGFFVLYVVLAIVGTVVLGAASLLYSVPALPLLIVIPVLLSVPLRSETNLVIALAMIVVLAIMVWKKVPAARFSLPMPWRA